MRTSATRPGATGSGKSTLSALLSNSPRGSTRNSDRVAHACRAASASGWALARGLLQA